MAVVVDSDVIISLERSSGQIEGLAELTDDETVAIAAVTASELLHGVHRADSAQRRARREHFVEAVLAEVEILPMDLAVARVHARIWADLAARGRRIGSHDMIIAATVLAHGFRLATRNVDELGRIDGLELIPVENERD